MHLPVVVRKQEDGTFTAQAVGIPELRANALQREDALLALQQSVAEWVERGELTAISLLRPGFFARTHSSIDPNEPMQLEFLEYLRQRRQEDLERTLQEYEEECPATSSIPTI